jgi:hypothetical protein
MREIIYSCAGADRQVGDFWNFIVCAGQYRTKREGWQVWCLSTLIFLETLHQLLHQFTFLSIPSLQVCFHHMSYNQCFDVNSERKKKGNQYRYSGYINLASNKKFTTLSITKICKFLKAMKWISCKINHNMFHSFHCLIQNLECEGICDHQINFL